MQALTPLKMPLYRKGYILGINAGQFPHTTVNAKSKTHTARFRAKKPL